MNINERMSNAINSMLSKNMEEHNNKMGEIKKLTMGIDPIKIKVHWTATWSFWFIAIGTLAAVVSTL